MIDLSIIIVSYNTKDFLLNCLKSVIDTAKNISYEIIVVDNASIDGTVREISNFKFQISNFKLIQNEKNEGFSKANNIGVKNSRGRYILFLNSDTIVYPETLQKMVEFMDEHKDCGVSTCRINLVNGKIDDASHRGFPTPMRSLFYFSQLARLFSNSLFFNGYHLGYGNLNKTHKIDACAGAFMMVRRKAGEDVGWLDEDYFFYGEDLDFCYNIKKKGWKIYYVPVTSILHYKGVSGGIKAISKNISTATKETKIRSTMARFAAMKIFYKKHYEKRYPKIVTWLIYRAINIKEKLTSL